MFELSVLIEPQTGRVQAVPVAPVWPDDDLTAAWLDGIAEARAAADQP